MADHCLSLGINETATPKEGGLSIDFWCYSLLFFTLGNQERTGKLSQ